MVTLQIIFTAGEGHVLLFIDEEVKHVSTQNVYVVGVVLERGMSVASVSCNCRKCFRGMAP